MASPVSASPAATATSRRRTPAEDRARYDTATAALDPPFAIVDHDAFAANATALVDRAIGKPIRVASKSVRCRDLLRDVLGRPGWHGVMTFALPEALWLVPAGSTRHA